MTTTALSLTDQFTTAIELVKRVNAIFAITSPAEAENAQSAYRALIQHEKELEKQYSELQCVKDAKIAQAQRKDLADKLDAAKKHIKNGPLLIYERAEEVKLRAEERRQQAIRLVEAEAERVRQVAEQKVIFDAAEKARKLAAKSGDDEAAAQAAADAEAAKLAAKDIASAPVVVPVVVLETSTPTVTRTKRYKWRITTKAGKVFAKEDFKKVTRLSPADLPGTDAKYFVLDDTLISGVVDSLGENAGIANVEVWSVLV